METAENEGLDEAVAESWPIQEQAGRMCEWAEQGFGPGTLEHLDQSFPCERLGPDSCWHRGGFGPTMMGPGCDGRYPVEGKW